MFCGVMQAQYCPGAIHFGFEPVHAATKMNNHRVVIFMITLVGWLGDVFRGIMSTKRTIEHVRAGHPIIFIDKVNHNQCRFTMFCRIIVHRYRLGHN